MEGIYKITNKLNGKSYIGQSIHCGKRLDEHCKGSQLIDEVIQIEGIENFNFEILKKCNKCEMSVWEDYYIMKYNTMLPNGYNKRWNCSEELRRLLKVNEQEQSIVKEEEQKEPWQDEVLLPDELEMIRFWQENFSKNSSKKTWIGDADRYKKYKYEKRRNQFERNYIDFPFPSTLDLTSSERKHYNSLYNLLKKYNDKESLWQLPEKLVTLTKKGKTKCEKFPEGYYEEDINFVQGWLHFGDNKVVLGRLKRNKNSTFTNMLVKFVKKLKQKKIKVKYFCENQEIIEQEAWNSQLLAIDTIEIYDNNEQD